jgi:hypothetical protein
MKLFFLSVLATLFATLLATQAAAQTFPGFVPGFCPPRGARVNPPLTLVDDLCNAKPANSYRFDQQSAPLSYGQKAAYFAENKIFSATSLFSAAAFGAIAQVRRDPPQWPQGAQGLGDRIGTRYAQTLTGNLAEFLLGFKEDPRSSPPPQYLKLDHGLWVPNNKFHSHQLAGQKIPARIGRALLGVVWTHYDSGSDGIAFSRIGGALASGVVGRAWTPAPTNTWGQVGIRTASAFGGYAAGAVFHEFEPDLTKLFARLTGQDH